MDGPTTSVLLVTYNRLSMLRECVAALRETLPAAGCEIVVWDNASDDGTSPYLDEVAGEDARFRIHHSPANIGVNAVAECVDLARGHYLIELDDDVVAFPEGWVEELIRAFDAVPNAGYLAANVVQDETTDGAKPPPHAYVPTSYSGVVIEHGPTGGWCTITSRDVISRIGNFARVPGRVFFPEDGEFVARCNSNGLRVGIVRDVVVYHATGAKANREYGTLEQCRTKYSDDPNYRPWLEETLREIDEATRDNPSES